MCYDQGKTPAPRPIDEDFYRGQIAKQKAECGSSQRQMNSAEILAELFSYHPPTPDTLPKFSAINQAAKNFAEVVLQNCPPSQDRNVVINCIRNARMFANAAITLNGLSI